MAIDGYSDYKSREFCRDIKCPVQILLDATKKGSEEFEHVRNVCIEGCMHTTREFHYWLIDKGYLIVKPEKNKV